MLTYPKSTMRVRRMPMHLSSGHVTLMPGKFSMPSLPPLNFPQSDLGRRVDSRWALPQISSYILSQFLTPLWKKGAFVQGAGRLIRLGHSLARVKVWGRSTP